MILTRRQDMALFPAVVAEGERPHPQRSLMPKTVRRHAEALPALVEKFPDATHEFRMTEMDAESVADQSEEFVNQLITV
ncbi:hypothetical protein [Streptomyces hundungensis]|uniref:hypothetical protein n=1 Tax=Streptomyces hundungensis TaxID=1077946 RepID=UPI003402068B